jgi:hypothetical protein
MAKIAKSQKSESQEREIWEAIIRYANARPDDSASTRTRDFDSLIKAGFDVVDTIRVDGLDDTEICDDVDQTDVRASLEALADVYRTDFRFMLAWLVAPYMWFLVNEEEEFSYQEFAQNAGDFLGHHALGIRMQVMTNTEYLPTTDKDLDNHWLVDTTPIQCVSVIAPVCKFILDQIVRHNKGEELRKVIPIGHCKRPGCERFFFIERVGRGLFCSDLCRVKFNSSKMTKEQNAEKMRKYRATLKDMSSKPLVIEKRTKKAQVFKLAKGRTR